MDYLIVYLEIIILCVVISTGIYRHTSRDLGSDREVIVFRWIVRVLIAELLMDGLTEIQDQGIEYMPVWLVALLYATYMFLASGILSYLWLLFAEMRIGTSINEKRGLFTILALPCVLIGIMSYASIKTGWFFSLDANGEYTRGPYWSFQSTLAYFYFAITTVHSFVAARKEQSPSRKKELYTLSSFIIAPIIGALLQLTVGGHPFAGPSICIAILFIFLSIQGGMIYTDSLTGLNNRKRTDQYLEEVIPNATEEPFYLYMLDIDGFKKINDTVGHVEGDRALKILAESLKKNVDEYHGFAGRYGGDEFVVVIPTKLIKSPDAFVEKLNADLKEATEKEHLEYETSVSAGYALCRSNTEREGNLIAKADDMLYENKQKRSA